MNRSLRIRYWTRRPNIASLTLLLLIAFCAFQIWFMENNIGNITQTFKTKESSKTHTKEHLELASPLPDNADYLPLQNLERLHDNENIESKVHAKRSRSLFPTNFYSQSMLQEVEKHKNFFEFDPRLLPSLYISYINREIVANKKLPENFALPFNWNMLMDNIRKVTENPLYEEIIKSEADCSVLREKIPYHGNNLGCESFPKNDENNVYGLKFKIPENTLTYFRQLDMRRLYANIHGLTSFKIPEKLIFLGALNNTRSLIIPTEEFTDGSQDITKGQINHLTLGANILVEEFIEDATKTKDIKTVLLEGIVGFDELAKLAELSLKFPISDHHILASDIYSNHFEVLDLDRSVFEWDLTQEIEKLEDGNIFKTYFSQAADPNFKELKHFGEAYLEEKKAESGHFDWRFFNGLTRGETELHQASIHRMLRSWFKFCKDAGIYSWINHGSLIGYYWNGYTLPNDNDIDVQVPIQSLYKLAQIANNSIIFDMTNDDYINEEFRIDSAAEIGFRSYYLDMNPLFGARTKLKSKNNVIDARLIDVLTGLYIDITALASFNSHSNEDPLLQKAIMDTFDVPDKVRFVQPLMYDTFYDGVIPKKEIMNANRKKTKDNIKAKSVELFDVLQSIFQDQVDTGVVPSLFDNLVNCRNHHFYNLNEFLPLVPTYFENTLLYIPSNWFKLMMVEYDYNVLEVQKFKGYEFIPSMKMWVPIRQCNTEGENQDDIREQCLTTNEYLKNEYHRLTPYIDKHGHLLRLTLPFGNLKEQVINIEDTFASKHFQTEKFKALFQQFDNSLLRPEPWIAKNLF